VFDIRKWSYLDVVTTMHHKTIYKLAIKLLQSASGSPAYLKAYKRALRKVKRKLSQSQRKQYRVLVKEWSEKLLLPRI